MPASETDEDDARSKTSRLPTDDCHQALGADLDNLVSRAHHTIDGLSAVAAQGAGRSDVFGSSCSSSTDGGVALCEHKSVRGAKVVHQGSSVSEDGREMTLDVRAEQLEEGRDTDSSGLPVDILSIATEAWDKMSENLSTDELDMLYRAEVEVYGDYEIASRASTPDSHISTIIHSYSDEEQVFVRRKAAGLLCLGTPGFTSDADWSDNYDLRTHYTRSLYWVPTASAKSSKAFGCNVVQTAHGGCICGGLYGVKHVDEEEEDTVVLIDWRSEDERWTDHLQLSKRRVLKWLAGVEGWDEQDSI